MGRKVMGSVILINHCKLHDEVINEYVKDINLREYYMDERKRILFV